MTHAWNNEAHSALISNALLAFIARMSHHARYKRIATSRVRVLDRK